MKLLFNLIWLIFGGLLMALGYAIVALVMFIRDIVDVEQARRLGYSPQVAVPADTSHRAT